MSSADSSAGQNDGVMWQHLDFYVRRFEGELVLVQTLLKQVLGESPKNAEIATFYYRLQELEDDWAQAVIEQGAHLEEGKSTDFAPPNEMRLLLDDTEEDAY